MAHYCKICRNNLPNEKFTGKGHKTHICKKCNKVPKDERNDIMAEEEITGIIFQKNISEKNILKLKKISASNNKLLKELAKFVLEIALVHPHKKNRIKYLLKNRRDLLKEFNERGFNYY